MKRLSFVIIFMALMLSYLHSDDYPNIAVINTNDDGLIGVVEKSAAKQFYMNHADIYDFVFIYTTFTPSINMQQGIPIQYTVQGIDRNPGMMNPYGKPADWGSFGKLIGAARMCNIDQYPDDPDAQISTGIINPYSGMSTIELQAHEWSHYWLSAMDFKKEGMVKNHPGLRGCEGTGGEMGACEPNQHWNASFMSGPSVMYGGDITDNEDETFTFQFDNPKKYGQLDLYVMGLIPPEEVGDLFFLCESSDIEQCREGSPAIPANKTSPDSVKSGLTKHTVTIEDIVRAMGERIPTSAESQKHFNIAFIIANKEGFYPFPNQIQRLENIRVRFQEWFTWATDGKATVCTELDGNCANDISDDDPIDDEDVSIDENIETSDETTEVPDEGKDEEIKDDTESVDDNNHVKDDISEKTDDNTNELIDDESGCGCTVVL